jgi:signal transduction histidine kinase/ActR/RegA family two-component response regulator
MFRGEFIGKRRDGSTFDVHLSLSLADEGDIICCCQDITEQKRIQTELSAHRDELRLANVELSRAAQHKDEFLASMSHELRTPLNGILGMTEIMIEQIVGKLNEKQLSCLRVVDESGKHLLALINDILDLSKIEAGALGLELSVVDARAVCEASLRVVRPAADAKTHKVNLNCPANPGYLRVDERRVKQMLVNLLDNAIKFTPAGGFVGLDIEDHPELGAIFFVVWDNGIGIAAEHQSQLFKPFSQIELGLAREHSGTGLGLSLVKRLAELHGGSVSVESSAARGSRFTISLPRGSGRMPVPAVRSITPGRPSRAVIAGTPTILVVDDNVPNLTMLRDYLAIKGFDVITAQSGQEALEIADRTSISAILMDIQMPGMDGLAAIRTLRRSQLHAKVPILATTAHVMPGDRERCLAAGATEYLAKPMSPRQIITILLRILTPALSVVT